MPKQNRFDKLADEIYSLAIAIIIALIMGYVVYSIAVSIIGQLPAIFGSVIVGLVIIYFYATNQAIRETINSWINDIRKRD